MFIFWKKKDKIDDPSPFLLLSRYKCSGGGEVINPLKIQVAPHPTKPLESQVHLKGPCLKIITDPISDKLGAFPFSYKLSTQSSGVVHQIIRGGHP